MDREELNKEQVNEVVEEIEISEELPEVSDSEKLIDSTSVENEPEEDKPSFEPQPETPPVYVYKPQKATPQLKTKNIFAIISMVISIAGLIFSCCSILSIPCSIAAIVFGILSLKSEKRAMAIAGIVIGGITLVLTITISIIAVVAYLYENGTFYSASPYGSHYSW